MEYIFSISEVHNRFVSIELIIDGPFTNEGFELQLPSWRPGRYEHGNFAKNIKGFSVSDQQGNPLKFVKVTKDRRKIFGNASGVIVNYQYYAAQPDAGACYVDHGQLYINPIHCCFFIPGRESEKCIVTLQVPENWHIATGMKKLGGHKLEAADYHPLVDSPFIASPTLSHAKYSLYNITFRSEEHTSE